MPKVYNPIPDPNANLEAMFETIKALKATIDILTNAQNKPGAPNQTFVQRGTPEAIKVGDNWVKPAVLKGETNIFSTWDGTRWLKII